MAALGFSNLDDIDAVMALAHRDYGLYRSAVFPVLSKEQRAEVRRRLARERREQEVLEREWRSELGRVLSGENPPDVALRVAVDLLVDPADRLNVLERGKRILRRLSDEPIGRIVAQLEMRAPLSRHLYEDRMISDRRKALSQRVDVLVTSELLILAQGTRFTTYPVAEVAADQAGVTLRPVDKSWSPMHHLGVGKLRAAVLAAQQYEAPRVPARSAGDAPAPRLIRSFIDAELVAAEWMSFFGYGTATTTPPGADGGIDVLADLAVAQVKMEALPVGRPVVQQLHGVAAVEAKVGVCFALAGYTEEAVSWADRAGLPLFRFDLQGCPEPANRAARAVWAGQQAR